MSEDYQENDMMFGGHGLHAMGILNALRTGDPKLDMILAMCLPFVIRLVFDLVKRFEYMLSPKYWRKLWVKDPKMHHRTIAYRTTRSAYGGVSSADEDCQNRVLQKAIELYLHSKVKLDLPEADMNLTTMGSKASLLNRSYYYDDDDNDSSSRTIVGILSKYKIVKNPPKNVWHNLGRFGDAEVLLEIARFEEGEGESTSKKSTTLSFHFKSTDGKSIDTFIDIAYDWYLDELKKSEDRSRYMYEQSESHGSSRRNDDDEGGGGSSGGRMYKRYRLSDEKTFESLFFREKESLLGLIRHFQERSGKYAVKGYPHKLGLLLHGPPGSGKTSMIKALAQHTGRSIVNVPLARIATNAELMSIFFDKKLHVEGEYVPVKVSFKDVIFVIEDVDAASDIVKRRDGKKTAGMVQTERFDVPRAKPLWHMLLESDDSSCQEVVNLLMEKSERLKAEALKSDVLMSAAQRMASLPGLGVVGEAADNPILEKIGLDAISSANRVMNNCGTVDRFLGKHAMTMKRMIESGAEVDEALVDELLGVSPAKIPFLEPLNRVREVSLTKNDDEERVCIQSIAELEPSKSSGGLDRSRLPNKDKTMGPSQWVSKFFDELNLQGLLNVLDGVVDSPGRILIMTSNHPEQLDPALIRPGRIDKKLYLGHMEAPDVIMMLQHCFQVELSEEQRTRVEKAISGDETRPKLNLTPAQVEQMTAEHDDVQDMILALERKGRSLLPLGTSFGSYHRSTLAYDV